MKMLIFATLLMGASAAGSRSGMNDRKSNNAHLWHEPRQDAGVVNRDVIVNYDAEEIERGLKAHNDYRREQGASDMLYMHWNDTLAKRAQERADKCVYAHGSISGAGTPWANVGENLYVSSVSYSLPWAVDNWALGEIFYYDYDTATCQPGQMCGHYTQVVWAKTDHVGCGVRTCTPVYSEDYDILFPWAVYTVCNYGPMGNYVGAQPYTKGDACTECSTGQFQCFDGLCRNCTADDCAIYEYDCQARCENCATISDTCECECTDDYRGIHCQTLRNGQTDPGHDCPTATPAPPSGACGAVHCRNGGTAYALDETECICICGEPWTGPLCESDANELKHAVLLNIFGNPDEYEDADFYIRNVAQSRVNEKCKQEAYFSLCCPGETYNGPYPGTVTSAGKVHVVGGYPRMVEGTGMYEVAIFVTPRPDNHLCASSTGSDYYIPQSVVHDALEPEGFTIMLQLLGCCCCSTYPAPEWLTLPEVDQGIVARNSQSLSSNDVKTMQDLRRLFGYR